MDNFVKTLIEEVKSQGVFDEFRFNCCLADVDTKPAYQNVRNRVETAVKDFLAKQHWTPETNKVQLRERLRKHLLDSDVLDKGVDHIVDQVVNPKVATIFEPKIESIAYKYLGITPPPPPANPPPRPPLLPAPPLPPYAPPGLGHMNGGSMLKVETTASLLPTDLEQISPDSDRATGKEDSKDEELPPPGVDDDDIDDDLDDTTSPAFEPAGSIKEDINNVSLNTSDSLKDVKENDSRDAGASQTSQLSQVSSDSRLTIASTDAAQATSTNNSLQLASEEAQMPKFSENSCETFENSGRQLHFDIKQDAIKFEGTERKKSLSERTNGGSHALSIDDAIMCELKANITEVKTEPISDPSAPPFPPLPPAEPSVIKVEPPPDINDDLLSERTQNSKELKLEVPEIKPEQGEVKTEDVRIAPNVLSAACEELKDDAIKSPASASSSSQTKKHSNSHSSSHSRDKDKDKDRRHQSDDKQRRKSRERERERDRDKERDHDKSRSKTSSSSKHSSSRSSHSSSSKYRSSSSSKHDKSTTSTSSRRSNNESSSSASKRSSSRHDSSSSSSQKKHKSSSSSSRSRESKESHHSRSHNGSSKKSDRDRDRDRERERERDRERNKSSSNSASNSASNSIPIIQDDHNEEKAKLQKRHSNDSNDEGKPPGASSGKLAAEPADATNQAKSSSDSSAANDKESQSNGTNGTNGTTESMAGNVINVSDILQQSTVSFIQLSCGGAAAAPAQTAADAEQQQTEAAPAAEAEQQQTEAAEAVAPLETSAVEASNATLPTEPADAEPLPAEPIKEQLDESLAKDLLDVVSAEEPATAAAVAEPAQVDAVDDAPVEEEVEAIPAAAASEEPKAKELQPQEDNITHFEPNEEEFKVRLQLLEQHIKDRRMLLNVLSEAEGGTRFQRRSTTTTKRRLSSEASSSKQHSSSSCSSNSTSPNSKTSLVKRPRRDEVKTSPTPSELSVNSKENEELEKHEKGKDLSGRRLGQKLCQQQRYTNDDLYKPRPLLSQRSRRRGLDSII
ncbi:hypothetical protein KR222_007407 [Zaprionus bogoriensis]|nr:hypothetical protein KR222_007407 [Zaprionus bogoriensis]